MTLFLIHVSDCYVDVPIENYRPSLYHPYHLQSLPNAAKKMTFCIYKYLFSSAHCLCISVPWCPGNPSQSLTVLLPGMYMKKIWLLCCPVKRKSQKFGICYSMVICLFYINVYYCNEITCILMKDFDFFFPLPFSREAN